MRRSWNRIERQNQQRNRNEDRSAFIITPFPPAMIIARREARDNKVVKKMVLQPEHIMDALNKTPELKRRLILKIMEELLDSEAFLEAYPTLYDPRIADVDLEYRKKVCEEMTQIIVRLFRKNKVRPDDAEKVLDRAREDYLGTYVHSDKS